MSRDDDEENGDGEEDQYVYVSPFAPNIEKDSDLKVKELFKDWTVEWSKKCRSPSIVEGGQVPHGLDHGHRLYHHAEHSMYDSVGLLTGSKRTETGVGHYDTRKGLKGSRNLSIDVLVSRSPLYDQLLTRLGMTEEEYLQDREKRLGY